MDLGLDRFQGQLDRLNRIPRAYRMAMMPAIVILISAAYIYFLYLPAKQQLTSVREQHLQLQRKLAEVRAVASNEDAVKAEITALERKLSEALRKEYINITFTVEVVSLELRQALSRFEFISGMLL